MKYCENAKYVNGSKYSLYATYLFWFSLLVLWHVQFQDDKPVTCQMCVWKQTSSITDGSARLIQRLTRVQDSLCTGQNADRHELSATTTQTHTHNGAFSLCELCHLVGYNTTPLTSRQQLCVCDFYRTLQISP